jgi:hypothetical protein
MYALLRVIAEDLRAYANGDLPVTPDALRRLASTLDDIHQATERGAARPKSSIPFHDHASDTPRRDRRA